MAAGGERGRTTTDGRGGYGLGVGFGGQVKKMNNFLEEWDLSFGII